MHYAEMTQLIYKRTIRRFVQFMGQRSVAAATYKDIRKYIAYVSTDGASLSAVYRDLGVLRMFYDFLNLGGVVNYVAPRIVKLRAPQRNSLRPLTQTQVRRLISAARTTREQALIELFYASGARLSEVCNLKVEDLDLNARMAQVRGKNGKIRLVLLTDEAAKAIRAYIGDRTKGFVFQEDLPIQKGCLTIVDGKWRSVWRHHPEVGKSVHRSLVIGVVGQLSHEEAKKRHEEKMAGLPLRRPPRETPLSKMAVQGIIRKLAVRAQIKHVSPHTMRRTFATHLYENGASIDVIQALMGHVWISTTMKYARLGPDILANTFSRSHPRGRLNGEASQNRESK